MEKSIENVSRDCQCNGISVGATSRLTIAEVVRSKGKRPMAICVCKCGTSLDRKNTNGNYEPGNCQWATPSAQGRNKRSNRIVTFRGRSMTLVELSEITHVPYQRLHERIVRRQWDVERAVTTIPRCW